MRALLIHHRGAGGGAASCAVLAKAIRKAGWKVRSLPVKKADPEAIAKAKPDLIVVAGGDGTVAKVMRLLADHSVPLAIIPTGTANDIASSMGIDGDPETIIDGWNLERRLRLDIGRAEGPWGCSRFAEGVGFGAFADSLRRAPDLDGGQKLRAGRDALDEALREAAPLPIAIELDGKPLPDNLLLVEVMNVRLTGPRLPLSPGAEAGDGKLHVSWLPASRLRAMRGWLERAEGDPPVEEASGQEVRIEGGGAMMRIDDECCWLEPKSEVTIRLEGEPIQLLAPPEGPALAA